MFYFPFLNEIVILAHIHSHSDWLNDTQLTPFKSECKAVSAVNCKSASLNYCTPKGQAASLGMMWNDFMFDFRKQHLQTESHSRCLQLLPLLTCQNKNTHMCGKKGMPTAAYMMSFCVIRLIAALQSAREGACCDRKVKILRINQMRKKKNQQVEVM